MSTPTIDLRKVEKPKEQPRPERRLGPLKPGTVLTSDTFLNPEEREVLAKRGITLPPPPTGKIAEIIDRKIGREDVPVIDPNRPVIKLPDPVKLEAIPDDVNKDIEQYKQAAQGSIQGIDLSSKPEPVKADPKDQVPPATAPEKTFCPHCGWDQAASDPGDPTHEDKSVFLQSVLGQTRFVKAYSLLDGNVIVVFRTLTNSEADICTTQAALDAEAGHIVDPGTYFRTLNDYRLCLGLQSITFGAKKTELPDLSGYKTDTPAPKTTKLKSIVPYIYDKILVQEPIRVACGQAWYRFQRLAEHLESHVDNSNFWKTTEAQP